MSKISILVAAYNVEQYIAQTLDSALAQSYTDIELVCVDDGSTDLTGVILEEYAQKDTRVRVFHHAENRGLLAARHTGIMAAEGEYALFLDGDDLLERHACKVLLDTIRTNNVDFVLFSLAPFYSETVAAENQGDELISLEYMTQEYKVETQPSWCTDNAKSILDRCFVEGEFNWSLCNKMFAMPLLKAAYRFYSGERLTILEDALGFFMICCSARSYCCVGQPQYRYRLGSGTTTTATTHFSEKKMILRAQMYQIPQMLKQWLPQTGLEPAEYQQALCRLEQIVQQSVWQHICNVITPNVCEQLCRCVEPYNTREALLLYAIQQYKEQVNIVEQLQRKTAQYAVTVDEMQNSASFRLGQALLKPMQKIRSVVKKG